MPCYLAEVMNHALPPACVRPLRLFGRALRAILLVASMLAIVAAAPAVAESAPHGKSARPKPRKPSKKGRKDKRHAATKSTKGGKSKQAPEPLITTPRAPITIDLPIQRLSLHNGLRVVLNPDHSLPTVAVAVLYGVGSRTEADDRAGLSVLLERLMFQGSRNVVGGEHTALVLSRGGIVSSSSSPDRTAYLQVLPAGELAVALWLEADRMSSLQIVPEAFAHHREAAADDYRTRIAQAEYGPSATRLAELVFQGYWPYAHDGLTTAGALDTARVEWAQEYYDGYYAPGNAVLSIAGDFDPDTAAALVHRYFDGIARNRRRAPEPGPFPEQTSQRTAVLRDPRIHAPNVLYGFPIPPLRHPDHYALELLGRILGDGESSRLYQALVHRDASAEVVSAATDGRHGPDLFSIRAKLAPAARMGDVEKVIEGEIKVLGRWGPTEAEIEKARRRAQLALLSSLQSNPGRALRLGEAELFAGDAGVVAAELPRYLAVTADDIKRVCGQYLTPLRRTIVETYPPDPPEAADAAKPKAQARPSGGGSPRQSKPAASSKAASGKAASGKAAGSKPKKAAGSKPKASTRLKKPKK